MLYPNTVQSFSKIHHKKPVPVPNPVIDSVYLNADNKTGTTYAMQYRDLANRGGRGV